MASGNDVSDSWYTQFLQGIGAPVNALDIGWLKSWHANELSKAKNNPFNTTLPEPGSTSINSDGVQSYPTEAEGLAANLATIKNPRYATIVADLDNNNQLGASNALVSSAWGTHNISFKDASGATIHVSGNGTPNSATVSNSDGPTELQKLADTPSLPSWLNGLPANFILRGGEIAAGGILMVIGVIAVAETLGAKGVAKSALNIASTLVPEADAAKAVNLAKGKAAPGAKPEAAKGTAANPSTPKVTPIISKTKVI